MKSKNIDLTEMFQTVVGHVLLGRLAYLSIILTVVLFAMSLFVTLPFHPMWGFAPVMIGGAVIPFIIRKLSLEA